MAGRTVFRGGAKMKVIGSIEGPKVIIEEHIYLCSKIGNGIRGEHMYVCKKSLFLCSRML